MQDTGLQQFILELLEYAQTAKLSEFRLITKWEDYKFYRGKYKSYKLLLTGLTKSSDRLFKKYYKGVAEGNSNFNTLLAYQRFVKAIAFYTKELSIVKDMLDEYESYLVAGKFFEAFLGYVRSAEDMKDFRK